MNWNPYINFIFRCLKSQRGRPKKGDSRNRKESKKKAKKEEDSKIEIKVILDPELLKIHQVVLLFIESNSNLFIVWEAIDIFMFFICDEKNYLVLQYGPERQIDPFAQRFHSNFESAENLTSNKLGSKEWNQLYDQRTNNFSP